MKHLFSLLILLGFLTSPAFAQTPAALTFPDERLDEYYASATGYFDALGRTFRPVADLMSAANPARVTTRYRTDNGGHLRDLILNRVQSIERGGVCRHCLDQQLNMG